MSWFGGNPIFSEMEQKIEEATSESIPNGELDLSLSLEITDLIRSKKIESKQSMRLLKRRLTSTKNPNTQLSTLKLIDTCIKNCGFHFLVEISSREFMDSLVILLQDDDTNSQVRDFLLSLIDEWRLAFKGQYQLNYVEKTYEELVNRGFHFPKKKKQITAKFIESEVPPDWVDSDACMICSSPFSLINRKHHCRSCGGCYCQEHSSKSLALSHIGIVEPVRVCDTCYSKHKFKQSKNGHKKLSSKSSNNNPFNANKGGYDVVYENEDEDEGLDDDEELKKAIELSLKESQSHPSIQVSKPIPNPNTNGDDIDEQDEEMKAAIEASLRDFKQKNQTVAANFPSNNHLPTDPIVQYQNPYFTNQTEIIPQSSDVSTQEEESINLFVSLVERMKNQPIENVLQDKNLINLHEKIKTETHPKLQNSIGEAAAKYDTFLELNNKLSTINRLYDQLLEAKLARTYDPIQSQPENLFPQQTGQFVMPQQTGYYNQLQNQFVGYQPQPQPQQQQQQQPVRYTPENYGSNETNLQYSQQFTSISDPAQHQYYPESVSIAQQEQEPSAPLQEVDMAPSAPSYVEPVQFSNPEPNHNEIAKEKKIDRSLEAFGNGPPSPSHNRVQALSPQLQQVSQKKSQVVGPASFNYESPISKLPSLPKMPELPILNMSNNNTNNVQREREEAPLIEL